MLQNLTKLDFFNAQNPLLISSERQKAIPQAIGKKTYFSAVVKYVK